jgi:hypothetical protein
MIGRAALSFRLSHVWKWNGKWPSHVRDPGATALVCHKHFKSDDFRISIQSFVGLGLGAKLRRLLKVDAVPSVFDHCARSHNESVANENRGARRARRQPVEAAPDNLLVRT